MSLITLRQALLWCTLINYGVLILWVIFAAKWPWPLEWSAKLFKVPRERIDAVNFAGIVFYKAAIILFNLVPLIAVYIVGGGQGS